MPMKLPFFRHAGQSLICLFLLTCLVSRSLAGDWLQFRGHRASGLAEDSSIPSSWNPETWENVAWKTQIPGMGHACPIIVGERIFIVSADAGESDPELKIGLYGDIKPVKDDRPHRWTLYCLSRRTGGVLWSRLLHEGVPEIQRHTKASHANSTPASDGHHVVTFLGSEGLYCHDIYGHLLWSKDFGKLDSGYYVVPAAQWGFASSPIIFDGKVIVQCDVQTDSFLTALDLRSGQELWKTPRQDVPTWSTPTIFETESRTEIVINGFKHTGGYDPSTGAELWKLSGGGDIPVPAPIVAHDLVYLSTAHGARRPLRAIRPGAKGDITPENFTDPHESIAWNLERAGIYMQTPIIVGDLLYACRGNGLLSCYQALTGERVYQQRLGKGSSGFTASAVATNDKLFFSSEDGQIFVVQTGPEFKLLSTNEMNEVCMATPAISHNLMVIRTKGHVYGIGDPALPPTPDLTRSAPDTRTRKRGAWWRPRRWLH